MGENAQQAIPRPAVALAVQVRSTGDGGGFSRSTMRHPDTRNGRRRRNATDWADGGQDWTYPAHDRPGKSPRCYWTSFSKGRRRWPCGDFGCCDLSAAASSGNIASHNAFNSESVIRWSFIRSSRIATDTNSAVSRSLPSRTARHCSRVARTERNRSSELATGVFSVAELAR